MPHTVTIQPSGHSFTVNDGETVLAAALREGFVIAYGCRHGVCGTCKGKLIEGTVDYGIYQEQAMSAPKNFNELESWLNEHRVTEVECLVPDLTGVARGKILPREKFTEDRGMRLPEVVVAMSVTGEYPAEGPYFDVVSRIDTDMHLVADPTTVRIVPWAADPTAQVIHDCYDRHGQLVPFAPRAVLRRVCELFDRKGWVPVVAPELEFYLVARNTDPDMPLKAPIGRSEEAEVQQVFREREFLRSPQLEGRAPRVLIHLVQNGTRVTRPSHIRFSEDGTNARVGVLQIGRGVSLE